MLFIYLTAIFSNTKKDKKDGFDKSTKEKS